MGGSTITYTLVKDGTSGRCLAKFEQLEARREDDRKYQQMRLPFLLTAVSIAPNLLPSTSTQTWNAGAAQLGRRYWPMLRSTCHYTALNTPGDLAVLRVKACGLRKTQPLSVSLATFDSLIPYDSLCSASPSVSFAVYPRHECPLATIGTK